MSYAKAKVESLVSLKRAAEALVESLEAAPLHWGRAAKLRHQLASAIAQHGRLSFGQGTVEDARQFYVGIIEEAERYLARIR